MKPRSFKSSEQINEKGKGSYRGFGYLSLFSDPTELATWSQENYCNYASFNSVVDTKTIKSNLCKIYSCPMKTYHSLDAYSCGISKPLCTYDVSLCYKG